MRLQPLDAILAASTPNSPAMLVARPHGVLHVYAGPLTPGGAVPRTRRPVCNARTSRLYASRDSLPLAGGTGFVCARCSARLSSVTAESRAEHPSPIRLMTRADDMRRLQGLTVVDIYLSARFAISVEELDECALALTLSFSNEEAADEYQSPTGRTFSNLPKWIDRRRSNIAEIARREDLKLRMNDRGIYLDSVHKFEAERRQQQFRRAKRQYV